MSKVIVFIGAIVLVFGAGYLLYTPDEDPVQQEEEEGVETELPAVSITTQTVREEGQDYRVNVEYPSFGTPGPDALIETSIWDAVASLKAQAEGDAPVSQGFRPYELTGGTAGTFVSDHVLSARITLGFDYGGAHPLPVVQTFSFDRASGRELTLDDALAMIGMTIQEVAAGAREQLEEQLGESVISPEGANAIPDNYSTFTIDAERVTFIFQPYQVGPYTAGTPEVVFPRVR